MLRMLKVFAVANDCCRFAATYQGYLTAKVSYLKVHESIQFFFSFAISNKFESLP